MEIKNLRKVRESFTDKNGQKVEFDAYYMTINGKDIKFKPAKTHTGLVDYFIDNQK